MNNRTLAILVLALISAAPFYGLAQTSTSHGRQQEKKIVISANEVMLDAVVKDKKGRVVKDLKPSDFEVFEDGVRQEIASFRLVDKEEGEAEAEKTEGGGAAHPTVNRGAAGAKALLTNPESVGLVALVFDRLSPNARELAHKAALSYVGDGLAANDFVGVFGIDLSLRVYQTFTNNADLLKGAVDRASSAATSVYADTGQQVREISDQQGQLEASTNQAQTQAAGGGAGAAGAAATIGANSIQQTFNQMTQQSLEEFDMLEQNQQGLATTNGLLALITSMSKLPGRKEILFFSEGLKIPPAVQSPFQALISNANRANVSIYTVDAAGLRGESVDAETGRELTALGQARMRQAMSTRDNGGPMMRDLERNEALLNRNPEGSLGQLAGETGGMLISSTNNLSGRLRQIDNDLHTYYAITYSPKNQDYDGKFRKITVKLDRGGLEVQTRKGYYAINASYNSPVLSYEAQPLAILSGKAENSSFPSRTGAFNFPEPGKPGMVPILVSVPTSPITFSADGDKKAYNTDFSVVALIKDGSGKVVNKVSNQYDLSGPLDKLAVAKQHPVLFYREVQLDPGDYTVDTVVYDAMSKKYSTSKARVRVPDTQKGKLQMSSVMLIQGAERLSPAEEQRTNPFYFGELVVYPNMGEPLSKTTAKDFAIFTTIYPAQGAVGPPKLTLEILKDGHSLGHASLLVPAPDKLGRIQYATAVPTEKYAPGEYELKLTASDGQTTVTRSAHVTLRP